MSKQETPLFSDTLTDLNYGALDLELGAKLHELVSKCENSQRQGSITLKLTIKPGGAGRIHIHDEVKVIEPKEQRGSSIMFVTPEGRITRQDPRQLEIEGVKNVTAKETGEVRSLPAGDITPLRSVG